MITGITVISPSVESRANRITPHIHPDLCRRRVHSALCCGCVSHDEPAAAALDVFALAHTAVIHSDWLTDFFCINHQAPTTPPVAPLSPRPTPPPPAPVRNPIFPKQPLHLKVTCCLSEPVACAAQPVIDPIIVLLERGWGGLGWRGLQQALGEVRWPHASCPSSAPASSLAALYGDQTWKQLSCVFWWQRGTSRMWG